MDEYGDVEPPAWDPQPSPLQEHHQYQQHFQPPPQQPALLGAAPFGAHVAYSTGDSAFLASPPRSPSSPTAYEEAQLFGLESQPTQLLPTYAMTPMQQQPQQVQQQHFQMPVQPLQEPQVPSSQLYFQPQLPVAEQRCDHLPHERCEHLHEQRNTYPSLVPSDYSASRSRQQHLQQHQNVHMPLESVKSEPQQPPQQRHSSGSYALSSRAPQPITMPLSSHAFPPTIHMQQSSLANAPDYPSHINSAHMPSSLRQSSGGSSPGGMHAPMQSSRPYVPQSAPMAMGLARQSSRGHAHTSVVANRFGAGPDGLGQSMTPPSDGMAHLLMDSSPVTGHSSRSSPQFGPSGGMTGQMPPPPIVIGASSGRRMVRSTSQGFSPTGIAVINEGSPRQSVSGRASPHGLKRKTSHTNLGDLSPPRIGGASEKASPAPTSSTKKGKGMGRKTKSDASLLTATERKQRRLQRKAELARVSRRKKKMNLSGMEARVQELQEAIAALESGREVPRRNFLSPSASLQNLALTPSSSTNSLGGSSKRLKRNVDDSEDEDSEDDEEDEDAEDEDDEDEDEEGEDDMDTGSSAAPSRKSGRMNPSISAPHLAELAATPTNRSTVGSPVLSPSLSRRQSAATVSLTPGPAFEEQFDLRSFMPVRPIPPTLASSGWMHTLTRAHLPTLHRHTQDTLRNLDQQLRLDSFEKLLRWLVQQATLAQSGAPVTNSAAQQAAQAWSFLTSQLELAPNQASGLSGCYGAHQSLQQQLEALRQSIMQASVDARAHVSRVDSFLAMVEIRVPLEARQKLTEWIMRNQQWVASQTSGAAAAAEAAAAAAEAAAAAAAAATIPLASTSPLLDLGVPMDVATGEGGFAFSDVPSSAPFQTLPSLMQTSELDLTSSATSMLLQPPTTRSSSIGFSSVPLSMSPGESGGLTSLLGTTPADPDSMFAGDA